MVQLIKYGALGGGNDYVIINDIKLYISSTAPTSDIPNGSVGVDG